MKFFDYIRFGLKNIWRQKARTVLTIFAIMIGATSVVAMLTIVVTAKKIVVGQIESAGALTLLNISANTDMRSDEAFNTYGSSDTGTKLTDETVATIKAIPHVNSASPVLSSYQLRTANLKGVDTKVNFDQINGVIPGSQSDKELSAGRNLQSSDLHNLVIGSHYLEKFGFKDRAADIIGQTVQFHVKGYTGEGVDIPKPTFDKNGQPTNDMKNMQEQEVVLEATITGVMSSSLYDNQVFIPMTWARQLMVNRRWDMSQKNNQPQSGPQSQPVYTLVSDDQFDRAGYTAILAYADSTTNVADVATKIKALKLGVGTAKEMIDQIQKMLNLLGLGLGAVGAISLAVAAIGVINTMVMATLERTREIGVLRACGATRSTIRRLFTFEAAMLGFWGGVFGVGVGYGLIFLARHFGGTSLAAQGLNPALIQIPLWLALATIGVTSVIGTAAGLFPAIRASRMNPVEALRYE